MTEVRIFDLFCKSIDCFLFDKISVIEGLIGVSDKKCIILRIHGMFNTLFILLLFDDLWFAFNGQNFNVRNVFNYASVDE